MNGIFVAIAVMNCTFASSGKVAMSHTTKHGVRSSRSTNTNSARHERLTLPPPGARPAPGASGHRPGADTDDVLAELGYTSKQIEAFREAQAVE